MLCTGKFLIFRKNKKEKKCCRVANTPTLSVFFETAWKLKKERNCFLIMERRRRVRREAFFIDFSDFP